MTDMESKPQTVIPDTPKTKKNTVPLIIAYLAIILAILSFLTQWFLFEHNKKITANLPQSLKENENLSLQNQKSILQLKEDIKQLQTAHAQNQAYSVTNETLLAEVEYLVTIAYYSLLFETNTDVAISLLETADAKLRQSADLSLIELRKALANNIIQLKMIPKIDIPGLILRINALSDQINLLSQKNIPVVIPKAESTSKPVKTWQQKLYATLEELKGLISIRRLHQPIKPLLSNEQQFYLLENIRLQLAQAQWAVLHRDQILYSQGLQRAGQLIHQYFPNAVEAIKLQQVIAELNSINLKPSLPDLTKTIELIQAAAKNLQNKNIQTPSVSTNSSIITNRPASNLPQNNPAPTYAPTNPNEKQVNIPNPIPRAMPS